MSGIVLKPCPFCGSKAELLIVPGKMTKWAVRCTKCYANNGSFVSDHDAVEAWNKRAELPSSQPEQRWIPCSKRLPPELKPVNVTWINRQPPTCHENLKDKPFTDTAVIYEGKWYWQSAVCVDLLKEYGESPADDVEDAIDIVAWMPLPEPFEDAAPVVHAHWKDAVQGCHDSPHVICSACGEYFWQYFKTFHYCPNCGAKMDGEVSG